VGFSSLSNFQHSAKQSHNRPDLVMGIVLQEAGLDGSTRGSFLPTFL